MEILDIEYIIKSCQAPPELDSYYPPWDVVFHNKGKNPQRNIFKFQEFNEVESEKIKRLKSEIQKNKLEIPQDWDDSDLLKFVYGASFKTKNAFKALKSCLKSRQEVKLVNYLSNYSKVYEILITGPLYFHGRDFNYRPLLIMNFSKFDLKKFSLDQYLQAACFLLEFVANNILTPGKVENWMCISDLGYKGLTDLPLNTMRKITQVLQDIFKCRLAYSAIINPPKTLYFIWSLLKPFLDPVTIDKISLTKDSIPRTLLQFFDPYQVEERYGGKAPNLEIFWPPVFPALSSNPDDDNSKFGGVLKNDSIKDEVVYQSGSISQDPKVPYEIESANIYEDRNSPEVSYIPEVDHPKISEKKRRKGKKKSKKLSEIIVDNPNALEPELEHGLNEEQLGSQKEHKFESITNANEADITDVHKHSIERNSVVYIDTEQKIEIDSPRDNKCLKFNKYELKVLCGVDCKRYCAIF